MPASGCVREDPEACEHAGTGARSEQPQWTYRALDVIGKGSFGVVALAEVVETGERVAIKRVVLDPHRTSRELLLLQKIRRSTDLGAAPAPPHPNVVALLTHYVTADPATGGRFLNLVMNYLPLNLHELEKVLQRQRQWGLPRPSNTEAVDDDKVQTSSFHSHHHSDADDGDRMTVGQRRQRAGHRSDNPHIQSTVPRQHVRLLLVKLILFQLARGLAWLHKLRICHRDVKPGNVLFNPRTLQVQLCDLGSAKEIVKKRSERNVCYICSRYYRAPELLFGALHYGCEVDLWSLGCIAAELVRDTGKPLFRGSTTVDQMSEIFKVLGAPSQAEMQEMSPQGAKAMALSHQQTYADPFTSTLPSTDAPTTEATGSGTNTTAAPLAEPAQPRSEGTREPAATAATASRTSPSPAEAQTGAECYDVLKIRPMQWPALFPPGTPFLAMDLVSRLLVYRPSARLTAAQVVEHPFFEELLTLDWQTLHLLLRTLPLSQGSADREPCHEHSFPTDFDDVDDEHHKEDDTMLLNALFTLTPGEKEIYSESFCTRMRLQYKRLEHALSER